MRQVLFVVMVFMVMTACDPSRVYETNYDFPDRYWAKEIHPAFKFDIPQAGKYNLYLNVRNESSFKNANLYFTYYVYDSAGEVLDSKLKSEFLFDAKTGEPFGRTVLGDIYDHQIPLTSFDFKHPGAYVFEVEQFTRQDSVWGMRSVGLRVERTTHAVTEP